MEMDEDEDELGVGAGEDRCVGEEKEKKRSPCCLL